MAAAVAAASAKLGMADKARAADLVDRADLDPEGLPGGTGLVSGEARLVGYPATVEAQVDRIVDKVDLQFRVHFYPLNRFRGPTHFDKYGNHFRSKYCCFWPKSYLLNRCTRCFLQIQHLTSPSLPILY